VTSIPPLTPKVAQQPDYYQATNGTWFYLVHGPQRDYEYGPFDTEGLAMKDWCFKRIIHNPIGAASRGFV
jgi:hypothetical protein